MYNLDDSFLIKYCFWGGYARTWDYLLILPRCYSLFRYKHLGGKKSYKDQSIAADRLVQTLHL